MNSRIAVVAVVVAGLLAAVVWFVAVRNADDVTLDYYLENARPDGEPIPIETLTEDEINDIQECLDRLNPMSQEELLQENQRWAVNTRLGDLHKVDLCRNIVSGRIPLGP